MNETNRMGIIVAAAIWIVLMAVVIFLAWSADAEVVEGLDDFVGYLDDHRDNASRLIVTLGALVLIVLALLLIIVELAPEDESREIRVEQAGATTIVPAEPLRLRLEEALLGMAEVTAARARVFSHDKGVGMKLDLTVTRESNVALVTQEASRVVVETLQADLGLPVTAPPIVRIMFGPPKAPATPPEPPASGRFITSSISQPPQEPPAAMDAAAPPAGEPETPPAGEPPAQPPPWSTGAGRPPAPGEGPPEEPPQR
ncbi:MAG: hypothetical protein WD379_00580 [Dehalococcoidia bacterium]